MIQALVTDIAQNLLTANSEWLSSIKSIGFLSKSSEGNYVSDDDFNEIGITDIRNNGGYIRQRSDVAMTIAEAPRITSNVGYTYTIPFRLVVALKSTNTTDIMFLLTRQIRSIVYPSFGDFMNVKCQATAGGNNTRSIVLTETGQETTNNEYRVIYVDFNLTFTDYKNCELTENIELPMDCECTNIFKLGCASTCDSITIEVEATTETIIVETQMNGSVHSFVVEQEIGENITIPLEIFNENYTHILKIYMDDERVTYTPDPSGFEYDCFQIEIKP